MPDARAISSAGLERLLYTQEVSGSIPLSPTVSLAVKRTADRSNDLSAVVARTGSRWSYITLLPLNLHKKQEYVDLNGFDQNFRCTCLLRSHRFRDGPPTGHLSPA